MTPSKIGLDSPISGPALPCIRPVPSVSKSAVPCFHLTRESLGNIIPIFVPTLPQGSDELRGEDKSFPPLNVYLRTFNEGGFDSTDLAASVIAHACPPGAKENLRTSYLVSIQPKTKKERVPATALPVVQFLFRSDLPLCAIKAFRSDILYHEKGDTSLNVRVVLWDQRSSSRKIRCGMSLVHLVPTEQPGDFSLKNLKPHAPIVAKTARKESHPLSLTSEHQDSSASFVAKFSGEIEPEDLVPKTGLAYLKSWGVPRRGLIKTLSEGSAATWGTFSKEKTRKERRTVLQRVGEDTEDTGWVIVPHSSAAEKA